MLPGDLNSREHEAFAVDAFGNTTKRVSGIINMGGAGTVGDGTNTLTAAGTPQQVSSTSVPCTRVWVQASEFNGDISGQSATVVVGGSTVVAATNTRRGKAYFPTQGDWHYVSNLNLLYWDATITGAKIHYYWEL